MNINEEISFLARHMTELSSHIQKLDLSFIELILENDQLLIENEDWLYFFANKVDCSLLQYVKFPYLSEETMNDFISHFNISYLNVGIWNSICSRLRMKIDQQTDQDKRYKTQTVDVKYEGKGLKGIIAYLKSKSKSKQNDFIEISSSSVYGNTYSSENLLELDNDSLFGSKNMPDQWILFDFKDKHVQLTNYSIKSSIFWGENQEHPKNWVLECSNDKKKWKFIDKKTDCDELNEKGVVKTFMVEKSHPKCRYFRLRQTGENWKGNHCFNITAVEFFGKLTITQ